MTLIHVKSRVKPDGTIVVPVGTAEAGKDVLVTVESVPTGMTQDEWASSVNRSKGSINDPTFGAPNDAPPRPAPDLNNR